ncbi:MAG: glycosyltransferase [Magnetococcus sp. WYHC-3]
MNPQRPIIAFAPHDWDDRWLSRQQLLSRLAARGWPVLYTRGALHLWERGSPRWRAASWRGDVQQADGVLLDRPGRWPPRRPSFPRWDLPACRWHGRRLLKALGCTDHDWIAMLFHPQFQPYVTALNPRRVHYHVYDHFAGMDDWTPQLENWQRALVARADTLSAAAPGMAAGLPAPGPARARLLYNGADAARFAAAVDSPEPTDLAAIPRPRLGYVGTINAKIDLPMIEQVAAHRPDWHWVFIGPVRLDGEHPRDLAARHLWERVVQRPNIHVLGARLREEVPAYVAHMDVNTICYRVRGADDWVVHGYPVKLHECLASGRPVVAAPQDAVCRLFSHVVAIAHTPEAWEAALAAALEGGGVATAEQRRQVALANTWDSRVDLLESWLSQPDGGGTPC